MKKKFEEFINYIRVKGANLLELLLQNYNLIFYGCLFGNLSVICIIFIKELYLLSFIFAFSMLVILNFNKLIKMGDINIYADAHKRILFMNIFLLLLNIINIFFNVFRYIFYDVIKIIRQYTRNILLNYFDIEITEKIDFYIDNIVAYISWDVVYVTVIIMGGLLVEYFIYIVFDGSKEDILVNDEELGKKLFGYFRNNFLLNLSRFCSISGRLIFAVPLFDKYIYQINNKYIIIILLFIFIFSVCGAIIFGLQFTIRWYLFIKKG